MELQHLTAPGIAPAPFSTLGTISLRPAVTADAEVSGRIIHEAFQGIAAAHGFPSDFPPAADGIGLAEALIADLAVFGVVAEADGRVVGSNFLSEGDAIRAVGPTTVDPRHQGRGVRWRLMSAVLERAGLGARVRTIISAASR